MLYILTFLVIPIFLVLVAFSALAHIVFLVPYVPSSNAVVKKMIDAARLKKDETVFDLGCGDARLLIAAEKKARVKTVGFEIAPLMYLLSKLRILWTRCSTRIRFKSFYNANLREANVIFCYLFPNVMPRLSEKIKKECRKGTRIVSNTFHIPGLKLSKVFTKDPGRGLPTIYVYKI